MKILLLFLFSFTASNICLGQSIRKDYREMSDDEKEVYIDVLWDLWNEGDVDNIETYM